MEPWGVLLLWCGRLPKEKGKHLAGMSPHQYPAVLSLGWDLPAGMWVLVQCSGRFRRIAVEAGSRPGSEWQCFMATTQPLLHAILQAVGNLRRIHTVLSTIKKFTYWLGNRDIGVEAKRLAFNLCSKQFLNTYSGQLRAGSWSNTGVAGWTCGLGGGLWEWEEKERENKDFKQCFIKKCASELARQEEGFVLKKKMIVGKAQFSQVWPLIVHWVFIQLHEHFTWLVGGRTCPVANLFWMSCILLILLVWFVVTSCSCVLSVMEKSSWSWSTTGKGFCDGPMQGTFTLYTPGVKKLTLVDCSALAPTPPSKVINGISRMMGPKLEICSLVTMSPVAVELVLRPLLICLQSRTAHNPHVLHHDQ